MVVIIETLLFHLLTEQTTSYLIVGRVLDWGPAGGKVGKSFPLTEDRVLPFKTDGAPDSWRTEDNQRQQLLVGWGSELRVPGLLRRSGKPSFPLWHRDLFCRRGCWSLGLVREPARGHRGGGGKPAGNTRFCAPLPATPPQPPGTGGLVVFWWHQELPCVWQVLSHHWLMKIVTAKGCSQDSQVMDKM